MRILTAGAACLVAVLSAAAAHATVTGYVIENETSDLTTPPDDYATTQKPAAQFTASGIDFETSGGPGNNTAAGSDSPSTTMAGFTALVGAVFSGGKNGFSTSDVITNTDWVFTGQTYLNAGNNSFVVGHDDGAILTFPDLNGGNPVVDVPQDTAFSTTPFTVSAPSAGLYAFTLQYHENNNGPADILFTINGAPVGTPVPEPASLALLGMGLSGLGLMRRRRNPG